MSEPFFDADLVFPAAAFTEATGIKTYKWNVADYDSSKAGIAQVEADLGLAAAGQGCG